MKFKKYLKRKQLKTIFEDKLSVKKSIGLDGITTNKFGEIIDIEIDIIKRKIKNKTYNITPYKERLILKNKDSLPRAISIPTNRDKLAFSALNSYLTDQFENIISNQSVHDMIVDIQKNIESNTFDTFIKIDIKNFYPSIDHEILMNKLSSHIDDEMALNLLEKAIQTQTIASGRRKDKNLSKVTIGVPQGISFSTTLSSIYLKDFDKKYLSKKEIAFYRFVDDMLILCNKNDLKEIITNIQNDFNELKLITHAFLNNSEKSSVGKLTKDKFQFLGFEFFNKKTSVRESSVDMLRNSILEIFSTTPKRKELYRLLNLKITGCVYNDKQYGWLNFFSQIDDLTLLYSLDAFVKKCFDRFKINYDENKIKKFSRTYYELKNMDKTNYIPKFDDEDELIIDEIKLLKLFQNDGFNY